MPPLKRPDARRELRLALVMNGGISLAVWMGGVTREIDALRRASFEPRDASGTGTLQLWQSLLDGLRARLLVDIVAGASAGGINGAILATAIARGRPLPALRDRWIEIADFDSTLLERSAESGRQSILNGDMFAQELVKTFREDVEPSRPPVGAKGSGQASAPPQWFPDSELWAAREKLRVALERERVLPRAVTLVMTGTALRGLERTHRDAIGQSFAHADSRVRFRFSRDVGVEKDRHFADSDDEDQGNSASARLACAARATASFPGAFEPTFVRVGESADSVSPDMAEHINLPTSRWVIDGGVLDNEPFAPVFEELTQRPIDTEVHRIVAYIVPSQGDLGDPPSSDPASTPPGMIDAGLAAVNLPRDLDILRDLEAMRELQLRAHVDRLMYKRLLEYVLKPDRRSRRQFSSAAASLYPLYRRRRFEGSIWESRVTAAKGSPDTEVDLRLLPDPDLADELIQASDEFLWIPPPAEGSAFPWDGDSDDPTLHWQWGVSVATRFVRAMVGQVRDALENPNTKLRARASLASAAITLSACLDQLIKITKALGREVAEEISQDDAFVLTDAEVLAETKIAFAATTPNESTSAQLGLLVRCAAAAAVRAPAAFPHKLSGRDNEAKARFLVRAFLQAEVLGGTTLPAAAPKPVPRFTFHRFGLEARSWYFKSAKSSPAVKLTGTRFGHFGAFFKRAWRWYDWTWGRLDGASHLVNILLDRDRLAPAFRNEAEYEALRNQLNGIADGAGEALDRARIAFKNKDAKALAGALKDLRGLVTRELHREIVREELPQLASSKYWNDLPADIPSLSGSPSDHELQRALELMQSEFTTTSLEALTDDDAGREAKWITVASALRALRLDKHVPSELRGPLHTFAEGVRALGDRGRKGDVARGIKGAAGWLWGGFGRLKQRF